MLISLQQVGKTIGTKVLYTGLDLTVNPKEKLGLVGRNGIGKSTLLGIMSGADSDYTGSIERRRGLITISTAQEHRLPPETTTLEYILGELPEYAHLHHIIATYPETMGEDMDMIHTFTEALTRFDELGYYQIEEKVLRELEAFQIGEDLAKGAFMTLSGGQKRLAEIAKVTVADGDLALIDEPTNHMDYIAKAAFIDWLQDTTMAVVVITHDRDVLACVDRIVDIKDGGAFSYNGDYNAYLKQNAMSTQSGVEQYEVALRTLENLQKQIQAARAKKAGSSKTPNPFIILERRLQRQYDDLAARTTKPSFWIDQESVAEMKTKTVEKYDKYKAKNIRMGTGRGKEDSRRLLIGADQLSLGYNNALFEDITFRLNVGERLELKGRNGVGKSTIIKYILATAGGKDAPSKVYQGSIEIDPKIVVGIYEQEIDHKYLSLTLGDAVEQVYYDNDLPFNQQKLMQVLSDYLFDPQMDSKLPIQHLSGGQKARFQLIKMLSTSPNLLILDEPTNHLDLPSIEELEKMLETYHGAVLYVSHDSYFTKNVGGDVIEIRAKVN